MPLWRYACPFCDREFAKVAPKAPENPPCPNCGEMAERAERAPTTTSYERIDNGYMVRSVERIADVQRLSKERSRSNPR